MKYKIFLFILLFSNSALGQNKLDSEKLIGEWFLKEKDSTKLVFSRTSILATYSYEELVKGSMSEASIVFKNHKNDEKKMVKWEFIIHDPETGEQIYMKEYFYWKLDHKTKIIKSELSNKFQAKELKLDTVSDNRLVLLKINAF